MGCVRSCLEAHPKIIVIIFVDFRKICTWIQSPLRKHGPVLRSVGEYLQQPELERVKKGPRRTRATPLTAFHLLGPSDPWAGTPALEHRAPGQQTTRVQRLRVWEKLEGLPEAPPCTPPAGPTAPLGDSR